MKLDRSEFKKEVIPLVLLGASVVCAVLIMVKTTSFFAATAKAEIVVKRAAAQNGSNDKELQQVVAQSCAMADDLKKANLFTPPPAPKRHPVTSVLGILGDEALIGSKWYKVGDKVQDARIVAVEATQIRVEWQGREKIFAPLQATGQFSSGGSRRTSRSPRLVARANSPTRRSAQMVQIGRSSSVVGGGLTTEQREKLRQKAEKQRQAIEKKELQRASREDASKSKSDKKKKSPDELRKAKEKAAEKRARKLARK